MGFRLSGTITDEDYKAFAAQVEAAVAKQGKIKLLLIVEYPQGLVLKAVWDDLVFWVRHVKDIERLAIVGQKEWERWIEFLERPFIGTEVRYYSKPRLEEAWEWLRSQSKL